jgi:uncharacterized protein HemY
MWYDAGTFLIIFVVWYTLMRFIFPVLGIPTCMSGACQVKRKEKSNQQPTGTNIHEQS